MNPGVTIDAMRTAAHTLRTGDVREKLHALQSVQYAIDAAQAALLAELEASKEFELDGASTLNTWVRNELRMNAGPANALVRNAIVLRDLPLVAEAAFSGQVSAAHVRAFVYGLKHVGLDPMRQHEDVLLAVALEHEPAELFESIKHLQGLLHPQDLDDAYERGMDKEDINVDALPEGFHITGFLNTVTGAKLKKVLDSVSAPRDKDDDRPGSERRVQGLDDLLSSILANGLPSDKGVKPHLSVFVDADTLEAAAQRAKNAAEKPFTRPDPTPATEPATLAGHGPIGPSLLMYFLCVSELTAFLMEDRGGQRQAQVLNAGTAKYQPNILQRRAVIARQKGVCATPGCNHTHLEIHHTIFWSMGGPTDLDLLIGLCTRCHHLLHRGRLAITGDAVDGFEFTNFRGRSLRKRRRSPYRQAA
ncbi:HNH endonuclease signature motif containing protein [Aeromicrobium sp. 9AM]|uniref:HNH endonuclease n=1 Tax=Aeromicrobium sp. 9AM TaxID=2653126 RepID=UPI0012F2F4A0|nr:HNH endonuclease signature motif containing protein [Aeromicrobium sp. 9AM]VXC28130.1 conserved hypothetical protein [Aeromicrobium sp. 9AM]